MSDEDGAPRLSAMKPVADGGVSAFDIAANDGGDVALAGLITFKIQTRTPYGTILCREFVGRSERSLSCEWERLPKVETFYESPHTASRYELGDFIHIMSERSSHLHDNHSDSLNNSSSMVLFHSHPRVGLSSSSGSHDEIILCYVPTVTCVKYLQSPKLILFRRIPDTKGVANKIWNTYSSITGLATPCGKISVPGRHLDLESFERTLRQAGRTRDIDYGKESGLKSDTTQ